MNPLTYCPAQDIPKDPLWGTVTPRVWWHRLQAPMRLKRYQSEAQQVAAKRQNLSHVSLSQLQQRVAEAQVMARAQRFERERQHLLAALALLAELAQRLLNMAPYEVQLVSVLAMHDRHIVQLAPGEGKTLTIGLLGVLHGWDIRPCHILTANDYLAQRDAETLAPLYEFCGVRVGTVSADQESHQKQQAYACDVVYTTAKQTLADFLTDRILFAAPIDRSSILLKALQGNQSSMQQLLMRGLYSVIVDEADNILVDEAITPMIISQPQEDPSLHQAVKIARYLVEQLIPEVHYRLDPIHRDIRWLEAGDTLLESLQHELPPIWRNRQRRQDVLSHAILARDYFTPDQHFVVVENTVVIVDESTGRTMPGRSWSYGLHQAIEARAGVPLTHPSRTLARMSFQNFFKKYHRLCGASGTLQNIAHELFFNYRVQTLIVPSRLPSQLRVHPYRMLTTDADRIKAVLAQVRTLHSTGIPVLLGTRTIEQSENYSHALTAAGLEHQLLNAKEHEREAHIVAQAGFTGCITVATNMAGRGTDIKLPESVLRLGGLRVLVIEPHESARVDWQLFGRAGRQGEPGEVYAYAVRDDALLRKNLPGLSQLWILNLLPDAILRKLTSKLIAVAQWRAQMRAFHTRRLMNHMTRESRKNMTFIRDD